MKTIPEEQAVLMRNVLLVQFVPLGVAIGAGLVLLIADDVRGSWIIAALIGVFGCVLGTMVVLLLISWQDGRLQRRLTTSGHTADSSGVAGWPAVTAVLSRAMPARKHAPFRAALYTANTPDHGPLPVAVRLAAGEPPAQNSGARLRLDPRDPAVAVIDPFATVADHAAAAGDPALAGLSRTRRGLALRAGSWLPWVAVGVGVAALTAVLLLAFG